MPSTFASKYSYFGAQRVATRRTSDSANYLHTDPLDSINVMTDASQVVQGTRNYYPSGRGA